ncbi:aromatic amino acid transaminase [Parathalassolituus penaei]|uniref:Aminotransferase n=1 Tax=Parathalassolituus penaei TaxID=2997323 RepID=A0A9X3EP32_9GAMM|nr:aromatic amino acid transaminase [Parathalassolituus penaei]MCY0966238.1 aromatic amino acid transaminase [Parathalassolituus penaei]
MNPFSALECLPQDPILGLGALYQADPRPQRMDLGIGIYKDSSGFTPILQAVREAERWLLKHRTSKSYLSSDCVPGLDNGLRQLALGDHLAAELGNLTGVIQSPGGTGALRLAAQLLARLSPRKVLVGLPTWPIHVPILERAGLSLQFWQQQGADQGFDLAALLLALDSLQPGDVVLLHACCHNPTGADPQAHEWPLIARALAERQLIPLLDMAYQGFGDSLDKDADGLRQLFSQCPTALAALSCSKNFGLYRDRIGALLVRTPTARDCQAASSHLSDIGRCLWSMPPAHGGEVVSHILASTELRALWVTEVDNMRMRISQLRSGLVAALQEAQAGERFHSLGRQRGMFSWLGLNPEEVLFLRQHGGIYTAGGGRINVSGLRPSQLANMASLLANVSR